MNVGSFFIRQLVIRNRYSADTNFTVEAYGMDIGTLAAPVINLTQAVGIGFLWKTRPIKLLFGRGVFSTWGNREQHASIRSRTGRLFFSRIYEGFWLYGDVGQFPESVSVRCRRPKCYCK